MSCLAEHLVAKINLTHPGYEISFMQSMALCYKQESYFDIVFICKGNIQVRTDQILLASVSPFLKDLFMKSNSDVLYVNLPDVEEDKLKLVLNFLYNGVGKVDDDELRSINEIFRILGICIPGAFCIPVCDLPACGSAGTNEKPVAENHSNPSNDVYCLTPQSNQNAAGGSNPQVSVLQPYSATQLNTRQNQIIGRTPLTQPVRIKEEVIDDDDDQLIVLSDSSSQSEAPVVQKNKPSNSQVKETGKSSVPVENVTENNVQSSESSSPKLKPRKSRYFTEEQIKIMVEKFKEDPHPDDNYIEETAKEFGICRMYVKRWFGHERTNARRKGAGTLQASVSPMAPSQKSNQGQIHVSSTLFGSARPIKIKEEATNDNDVQSVSSSDRSLRPVTSVAQKNKSAGQKDEESLNNSTENNIPSSESGSPDLKRRKSRYFTNEQIQLLVKKFKEDPNPDNEYLVNMAKECGVQVMYVRRWFYHERENEKKKLKRGQNHHHTFRKQEVLLRKEGEDKAKDKMKNVFGFNDKQFKKLEEIYENVKRVPSRELMFDIAQNVGTEYIMVKKWFENRLKKGKQRGVRSSPIKMNFRSRMPVIRLQRIDSGASSASDSAHKEERFPLKEKPPRKKVKKSPKVKSVEEMKSDRGFLLSKYQVKILEQEYEVDKFPNVSKLKSLSLKLRMKPILIKRWFVRKRKEEGVSADERTLKKCKRRKINADTGKSEDESHKDKEPPSLVAAVKDGSNPSVSNSLESALSEAVTEFTKNTTSAKENTPTVSSESAVKARTTSTMASESSAKIRTDFTVPPISPQTNVASSAATDDVNISRPPSLIRVDEENRQTSSPELSKVPPLLKISKYQIVSDLQDSLSPIVPPVKIRISSLDLNNSHGVGSSGVENEGEGQEKTPSNSQKKMETRRKILNPKKRTFEKISKSDESSEKDGLWYIEHSPATHHKKLPKTPKTPALIESDGSDSDENTEHTILNSESTKLQSKKTPPKTASIDVMKVKCETIASHSDQPETDPEPFICTYKHCTSKFANIDLLGQHFRTHTKVDD